MGDFRIPYGKAIGKQNNFLAGIAGQKGYLAGTQGLFGQGDTTPDVTNGCLFYANNSGATTITDFDLSSPRGGGQPGLYEGKEIKVWFLDTNTRLARSNRLVLSGTDGLQGLNNAIDLIYHNSAWYETNRNYLNPGVAQANSANLGLTGNVNVYGNTRVVEVFSASGSAATLRTAVGGEQYQMLTLIAVGGSNSIVIVNSAAADTFVTTTSSGTPTQFRMMNSGAITFVRRGQNWLEIRPVSGNSDGSFN